MSKPIRPVYWPDRIEWPEWATQANAYMDALEADLMGRKTDYTIAQTRIDELEQTIDDLTLELRRAHE